MSLAQALEAALADLDGFYTFAVGTRDGFAILRDQIACKPAVHPETGDWVAMAVVSDGSYGVAEGLISSFPCTCANGRYQIVPGLEIDAFSRARIDASVAELAEERDAVRELGLI